MTGGRPRLHVNRNLALDLWAKNISSSVIVKECGFKSDRQLRDFIKTCRRQGEPRATLRLGGKAPRTPYVPTPRVVPIRSVSLPRIMALEEAA
jgi:hypothetical protein